MKDINSTKLLGFGAVGRRKLVRKVPEGFALGIFRLIGDFIHFWRLCTTRNYFMVQQIWTHPWIHLELTRVRSARKFKRKSYIEIWGFRRLGSRPEALDDLSAGFDLGFDDRYSYYCKYSHEGPWQENWGCKTFLPVVLYLCVNV